jgi:hypothetical protein
MHGYFPITRKKAFTLLFFCLRLFCKNAGKKVHDKTFGVHMLYGRAGDNGWDSVFSCSIENNGPHFS